MTKVGGAALNRLLANAGVDPNASKPLPQFGALDSETSLGNVVGGQQSSTQLGDKGFKSTELLVKGI